MDGTCSASPATRMNQPLSVRSLLIRGMLVGIVAGLLAIGFAKIFGEPEVDRAINFENQEAQVRGDQPEVALVSRAVQSTIGLGVGVVVLGVAIGGIYALAFAIAQGRIGQLRPRVTAVVVAAGGYIAVVAVPFLKYPANPPSIGNPDTIGHRTELYFTMILVSVIAAIVAVRIGQIAAKRRWGGWNSGLAGIGAFAVIMTLVLQIMPTVNEVPAGFPADVLWRFRIASLGTQAVLWGTLGLLFGALTERSLRAELGQGTQRHASAELR